jgi:predicted nucleic acid-binding protein
MAAVTLLLDTNILWDLQLCRRLTEKIRTGHFIVYIPTLVHAERIRQVANHYGERFSLDVVRQFVADAQFELLPLSVADAEALAALWLELKQSGADTSYWHQHRFDIVLCAVARATGYTLVVEDRGAHFDHVINRINRTQLTALVESLS